MAISSFFRIVIGVYVILLGLQQISQAGINQKFIPNSLDFLSNLFHYPLEHLKIYCMEIIYIQNIFIIYSGLLLLFNYKTLSSISNILAVLMDLIFINNVFISLDLLKLKNFLTLSSICAGVLNS
jgi:hypothetical protein